MPGLYGYSGNANVAVGNTIGLYQQNTGTVQVLSSAQLLLSLLSNASTVGFSLTSANTQVQGTVLPNGVTAGTYGSGSQIPVVTVGADGRVTTATTVAIDPSSPGFYSNANVAAYLPVYNGNIQLSGFDFTVSNLALGRLANAIGTGTAIGDHTTARSGGVALGQSANNQSSNGVSIGYQAYSDNLTSYNIAVGSQSNAYSQGVAFGPYATAGAAFSSGNYHPIAIGYHSTAINGIAIGESSYATTNGIAIGKSAINTSGATSIVLNAGSTSLTATQDQSFYVNPIRNDATNIAQSVYYNTTTKELTYAPPSGSYSNVNVAAYLTTATINTTGNITGANLTTAGNLTANYVKGSGALLTALTGASAGVYGSDTVIPTIVVDTTGRITQITTNAISGGGSYGNTNVAAYLGSNTALTITTTANIKTIANVISPNYLYPNGVSILTGIGGTYSNTNVAAYLTTATINTTGNITGANLTTAGNVYASYVIGNGSLLTNLPTQAGTYSNANVAAYLPGYGGTILVDQVNFTNNSGIIEQGQDRITITGNAEQVNTGVYLNDTGEATVFANTNVYLLTNSNGAISPQWTFDSTGNLSAPGNITTTSGNIQAAYFLGNGSKLTNLPIQTGTYSNTNVAGYLTTATISTTGNITAGNLTTAGNVSGSYILGDGSKLTNLPGGSGTYGNANVAAYLTTATISTTGNITAGNLIATSFVQGDGSKLTNLPTQTGTYSNVNVAAYLSGTSPVIVANLSSNGYVGAAKGFDTNGRYPLVENGVTVDYYTDNTARINNSSAVPTFIFSYGAGTISNIVTLTSSLLSMTGAITATSNITTSGGQVKAANGLYSPGAFNGGFTDGIVVDYVTGNGRISVGPADNLTFYTGGVANTQTLQLASNGAAIAGNLITTNGVFYANGAVYGVTQIVAGNNLNISPAGGTGVVTINANTQAGTYSNTNVAAYLTTATISTTGNITGANLVTSGNVYGNYIIGNGSLLTNLPTPAGTYSNTNVSALLSSNTVTTITTTGNITTVANVVSPAFLYPNGVSILTGLGGGNYSNANVSSYLGITNGLSLANIQIGAFGTDNSATTFITVGSGNSLEPGQNGIQLIDNSDTGLRAASFVADLQLLAGQGIVPGGSANVRATGSNVRIDTNGGTYGGYLWAEKSITTLANIISPAYLYPNGVSILTGVGGTYSNTNVAAYLTTATISTTGNITAGNLIATSYVQGDGSKLINLPVQTGTYSNTNVAAYLPTYGGAISVSAANAQTLNVTSNSTFGNITVLAPNTATFNGTSIFGSGITFSDATVQTTAATIFNGNLLGKTLLDSTNERILMTASPVSPIYYGAGNFEGANFFSPNALTYFGNGVVNTSTSGGTATYVASANLTIASNQVANKSVIGMMNMQQIYPDPNATSMASFDRPRGVVNLQEIYLGGKTWGLNNGTGAANATPLVGMNGVSNLIGTGFAQHQIAMVGTAQLNPNQGSANVLMQTGTHSIIGWMSANPGTGRTASNIQYARMFGGTVNGGTQQANLTIANAIGLHTTNGWAPGGAGGVDTITNRYALLNEDAKTVIQTNGNISVTSTATTGFNSAGVFTVTALNAVTGVVGQFAAVSNGTGKNNGQMAYWDATNARWSWFDTNLAVS